MSFLTALVVVSRPSPRCDARHGTLVNGVRQRERPIRQRALDGRTESSCRLYYCWRWSPYSLWVP